MHKKNKCIELLAPAMNLNTAKSAIICGADAVYIGAQSFGARKSAGNSIEDIRELVNFAHKYGVKIYVTVNTILTDNELKEAEKLINSLYEIGADALIIQDMGLLELDLPPIELHASTQCDIRTLSKVKFLEEVGFKRVVLARELSLEEIKTIKENTNIELECFVHGALCVSYSGQCYMSASNGGRSANRGECAQACRKKYSLLTENGKFISKDKHLLSLKDFCAEKYLDDLVQIGVKSFKIEGRLKDENYVKNVVLYYRKLLDKYAKTSKGDIISDFKPDIYKTFNRGYTTYFLNKEEQIYDFTTPKSKGKYIGEVINSNENWFELNTKEELSPQDGLCYLKDSNLEGCLINKIDKNKIFPNRRIKLKKGDKIYRNQDIKFENLLKNSKTKRVIKTEIDIYKDKITAFDGEYKAEIILDTVEIAENKNKMKESFLNCFNKTANSIFQAEKINFKTEELPFLPISKLNASRNELYEKLENMRVEYYKRNDFKKTGYALYNEQYIDYRLNIHNKKAYEFYKKCGIEPKEFSPEKSEAYKSKELMRTKHCLRRAFDQCLKKNGKKENMYLIDEKGKKYLLKFDCINCNMIIIEP